MSRVTGATGLEPEGLRESRMVAIESSRRAAERLWREIGLLLVRERGSTVQTPFIDGHGPNQQVGSSFRA